MGQNQPARTPQRRCLKWAGGKRKKTLLILREGRPSSLSLGFLLSLSPFNLFHCFRREGGGGLLGRELSEVLSWGGTGIFRESTRNWVGPGAVSKVPMMRADGAGRTVCLSVYPGENYKALEAPAHGFAPAFLWAPGGRERERKWNCHW